MGHWACYHECCGQKFPLNPNLHQNTYFCLPCNVLLITLDSAQPSNITTVVVDIQDLNLFKIWTNYETWAKFLQKESSYPLKTMTERISFKPLIHCNSVEDSLPKWTGKQELLFVSGLCCTTLRMALSLQVTVRVTVTVTVTGWDFKLVDFNWSFKPAWTAEKLRQSRNWGIPIICNAFL